jgi:hypothetical protein
MRYIKNIICYLLIFLVLLQCSFITFASEDTIISARNVYLEKGEEALLSVNIDNNPGIMGFKIMLDYDKSTIEITDITQGTLTYSGNFSENLGLKSGHVDIIWSDVEQVSGSGEIFSISIKAIKQIDVSTDIKISYSKEDTFNEQWEDVSLKCKNITVYDSGSESSYETTESLTDTSEDKTNEKLLSHKQNEAKEKIIDNIEFSQLRDLIDESLKASDSISVNNIIDKEKFSDNIKTKLSDYSNEIKEALDDLNDDEIISLVQSLDEEINKYENNNGQEINLIFIFIIVGLCIIIAVLILLLRKRNKK